MKVQAVAYGLMFVLTVVLGPALLMALLLQGWARFQGWPAARMRNVAAATAGALAFGVLWASAVAADWMAVPNLVSSAVVNAYHGDLSWSASIGLFPWVELPIAAVVAWVGLHRKELAMVQSHDLRRSQRYFERTRRNQRRNARRRANNELTPLSRGDEIPLGHLYRREDRHVKLAQDALTERHRAWLSLSRERLNLHMTLVGGTGVGKSELLKRISQGWTEAAWQSYALKPSQALSGSVSERGGTAEASPRPLTIMVDAKGGRDAQDRGTEWAESMEALGVSHERVGMFPYFDALNMWNLPADQLRECIHEMCKTNHRFFDALQLGLLSLVLDAPGHGVPRSSADFLARLNERWLRDAWVGNQQKLEEVETIVRAGTLGTDLMLFDQLFSSIGVDFDAGRSLTDFDALYVSLQGTAQQRVASVKAKLLVELLRYELSQGRQRDVLFIFDEFGAVSELVDMHQLVRTARSLGGSLLLCSQSYYGLGATEADVESLLADMRGGHLVMAGQAMEPWSKICGTRPRPEVGAQLQGSDHTELATARLQPQFIVSPDELKDLQAYDVALIEPGSCEWTTVVRPEATKRLPSQVIHAHSQREWPTAGRAVPMPELLAAQTRVLSEGR